VDAERMRTNFGQRASRDHFGVFPLQWHFLNAQVGNSRLVLCSLPKVGCKRGLDR
jgi:hypothetical protein